jgi:hypothetical protein
MNKRGNFENKHLFEKIIVMTKKIIFESFLKILCYCQLNIEI